MSRNKINTLRLLIVIYFQALNWTQGTGQPNKAPDAESVPVSQCDRLECVHLPVPPRYRFIEKNCFKMHIICYHISDFYTVWKRPGYSGHD